MLYAISIHLFSENLSKRFLDKGRNNNMKQFLEVLSIFFAVILLSENSVSQVNLKFQYSTGTEISSSPAFDDDGKIYFGCMDKYVYALNPDGNLAWRYYTDRWIVTSSPSFGTDGTVYIGAGGILLAFNPDSTLKWSQDLGAWIHPTPVIADDGTIYVGNDGGYLYAINPDGTEKWRYNVEGNMFSSPVIGKDGNIYCLNRYRKLFAIDKNGSLVWTITIDSEFTSELWSNMALDYLDNIYVHVDNKLYAVNSSGSIIWDTALGPANETNLNASTSIGPDGTIYTGSSDNYMYAVNPDGTIKWKYETDNIISSTPLIDNRGNIYAAEQYGKLYALDRNGDLLWSYNANARLSSPTLKDGILYIGSSDGNLLALDTGTDAEIAYSSWPKYQNNIRNRGKIEGILLSNDYLEINNVNVGSSGIEKITIRNFTNETFSIDSIEIDNNFFSINQGNTDIFPDDSLNLHVTFSPISIEDQTANITINSSHGDLFLTVIGTVAGPRISLPDEDLFIGHVLPGQIGKVSFEIENTGTSDLIISNIQADTSLFTTNKSSFTIGVNQTDTIQISYSPENFGPVEGRIIISSNNLISNVDTVSVIAGYEENSVYFI